MQEIETRSKNSGTNRCSRKEIEQIQNGSRKGKSREDQIFTIKQLTERAEETKGEIYLAFIDLEKMFDNLQESSESLTKRYVHRKLRQATLKIDASSRNYMDK